MDRTSLANSLLAGLVPVDEPLYRDQLLLRRFHSPFVDLAEASFTKQFLEAVGGLVELLPAERSHAQQALQLALSVLPEVVLCQEATDSGGQQHEY